MYNVINNNGTNTVDSLNTRYTKSEVDTLIYISYNKTETGILLNLMVSTSGNNSIFGELSAWTTRCLDLNVKNNDDDNCLRSVFIILNRKISN